MYVLSSLHLEARQLRRHCWFKEKQTKESAYLTKRNKNVFRHLLKTVRRFPNTKPATLQKKNTIAPKFKIQKSRYYSSVDVYQRA